MALNKKNEEIDLFIKKELQKDKKISNQANIVFNNFKGGDNVNMTDKENKVIKFNFNKFLAFAASFVIIVAVAAGSYIKLNKNNQLEAQNKEEVVSKLAKGDTYFVPKSIRKENGKYEVTAHLLKNEEKKISEDEYKKILEGEAFTFRDEKYKIDSNKNNENDEKIIVTSGNNSLYVTKNYNKNYYYLEDISDEKAGGLADYEGDLVKFDVNNVDQEALNNLNNHFIEYRANVINGKIESIEVFDGTNYETNATYFKQEEIIGKVWQTEVDGTLQELIISDITDNKVTFGLYSYRGENVKIKQQY